MPPAPKARTAYVNRLSDELLIDIMRHCAPADFAHLRQVDRRWRHLACDPIVQRHVFAEPLADALTLLHRHINATAVLRPDYARSVGHCAAALCHGDFGSAGAHPSWIELLAHAQACLGVARRHGQIEQIRQTLTRDIRAPLGHIILGGFIACGVVCEQAEKLRCPPLKALGLCLLLVTCLFSLATPLLWFFYNVLGVMVEEWEHESKRRLRQSLAGPWADVDVLLRQGLAPEGYV